MRVRVDLESDALYFRICEEVSPGVILDYSKDGKVVGIEILGLKSFPLKELVEMRVELPTLKRGEMKILVTGGAGLIGSHLVDALAEKHEIVVLDSLEPQVHAEKPDYLNPNAAYIFGDMRDEEVLRKALESVEVIFHLASAVGVGQSMYEIRRYVEVNTMATAKLLDILVNEENEVKKLIIASSMSIYGEGAYECDNCGVVYPKLREEEQLRRREWELRCPYCGEVVKAIPTSEGKPLHPTSIYAITKRKQED